MLFRRTKKEDQKPKIDLKKKIGSFAFFFSIPACYFVALACTIALFATLQSTPFAGPRWALFSWGCLLGMLLFRKNRESRIRVLIHETKHAAIVILTGNRLKDFHIGQASGDVEYQFYESNLHLEPFVLLAPYFFPLFSLPTFVLALFLESRFPEAMLFLVGLTLGIDLITSLREVHPFQSDLRRIFGGWLFTRPFILGMNFMWCSVCLVWVAGGLAAFLPALEFMAWCVDWLLVQLRTPAR